MQAQAPGQGESSVGTLIDLGLDEPAPAYAAAPVPAYAAAPAPAYPAAPMGGGMMGPPGGAYNGLPYPEVSNQGPGAAGLTDQLAGLCKYENGLVKPRYRR